MQTLTTRTPEQNLAAAFAAELRRHLTAEQLADAVAANAAEQDANICHSHDYCDPNEYMLLAFAETQDREWDNTDSDNALIDAAWSIAKAAGFAESL